ncbi:MAG: C40 family peptidase [Candidatus Adiutrix sp.]|jgi:cell wall-associated NlpC family hydrolase|nr:C40 family peptidase [Candidatus Adiutrix sp.]
MREKSSRYVLKRCVLNALNTGLLALALASFLSGCGFLGGQAGRNSIGAAAAKTAGRYIGAPYQYGGRSPRGFDCSGLTFYVYERHGIKLPPSSATQAKYGRRVKKRDLSPGDLVFFRNSPRGQIGHVGIYIGDGKFIHAPGAGKKVTVSELDQKYFRQRYHSARRP